MSYLQLFIMLTWRIPIIVCWMLSKVNNLSFMNKLVNPAKGDGSTQVVGNHDGAPLFFMDCNIEVVKNV